MAASAQTEFVSSSRMKGPRDPEFELLTACCGFAPKVVADKYADSTLDWKRLLALAEHHRVIPVLGEEPVGSNPLRERVRLHAWRALRLTAELKRVAGHLQNRGVEFLAYKGPALGQLLYGDPAMRQFGDLDLLVRRQDVQRASEALGELGYEPELRFSARQQRAYLRAGYECGFALGPQRHLLELQWQIVPRFYAIDFDMGAMFERSIEIEIDGTRMRTLGQEDFMLALCVHAAKHEWSQMGMLRDIATLAKRSLDWNWIKDEARRLGMLRVSQVSLAAAEKLFEIQLAPLPGCSSGRGALDIANRVFAALHHNSEPDTESLSYFRDQLRLRERWRDQARFIWRLAMTPGVEEWRAVRLPERAFVLYRAIRIGRLFQRFALGYSR